MLSAQPLSPPAPPRHSSMPAVRLIRRRAAQILSRFLRLLGPGKSPPVSDAEINSILFLRFGGIGDMAVVTGLLRSLRKRYPKARITLGTAPAFVPVLEQSLDIDAIVTTDAIAPYHKIGRFFEAVRVLRAWSTPSVDLAIIVHDSFYMMVLAFFIRARFKLGFVNADRGFDFSLTHSVPVYSHAEAERLGRPKQKNNEAFHDLLRCFCGEHIPAAGPRIALSRAEIEEARATLGKYGVRRPPLVIVPGGTSPMKIWPIDRFVLIARRAAELGVSTVVLGGPQEAKFADLFRGIGSTIWFAAGELPLRRSIAIVHEAAVALGSDTGLIHVAAALGVPTATVYGPTTAYASGYDGPNDVIVQAELPCVPCGAGTCRLLPADRQGSTPPCLDMVTVDAVWAKLVDRLAAANAAASCAELVRSGD